MTFFITRPPFFTTAPVPSTNRTPIRLSRQAPAWIRRGPETFAATIPPIVGSPAVPRIGRWSIGSNGRCCPSAASAASTSASGVPARATIVSAPGSYSVIPVSPAVDSTSPGPAIPRVPPPRTDSGPAASRTASASSASLPGAITPAPSSVRKYPRG